MNFDSYEDTNALKHHLAETTTQLEAAAHMGLELVQQNHTLQQRLDLLQAAYEDVHERLNMMERDRRWMHEQSLRVDQTRASINELVVQVDGSRGRQQSVEAKCQNMESLLSKLKEDYDVVVQNMEQYAGVKRSLAQVSALQKVTDDAREQMSEVSSRLDRVEAEGQDRQTRLYGQMAEISRRLGEVERQMSRQLQGQQEAQEQAHMLASKQAELEQSFKALAADCTSMLNEHEQAIRLLSEPPLLHLPASHFAMQTPESGSRQDPARKAAGGLEQTPVGRWPQQKHKAPLYGQSKGEYLDDIFSTDHQAQLPTSPISTASNVGPHFSPLATSKAASVIGNSYSADRPQKRPARPRVSSFSRVDEQTYGSSLASPSRIKCDGIISPTAHVGVGWGKYWEARKQGQFDLQSRLGLTRTAACSIATDISKAD
ncbi:hypothetical protein EV183_004525 [Coemansia sp. RSA 2336]|nr:hypothetical protein EV183_004525 [Coemansia sp. RSA 2336]